MNASTPSSDRESGARSDGADSVRPCDLAATAIDSQARPASGWLVLAVATLIGTAFFQTEHSWKISTFENYQFEADEAGQSVSEGRNIRRLAYVCVGMLGATLLLRRGGAEMNWASPLMLLGLMFVAWSVCSLLWSVEVPQATKRLVVAGLSWLGVLGVARQLSTRNLITVAAIVATAWLAIGVGTEFVLKTFKPLSGEYRFAGTVHPNSQASYCAVLCMAAWFGLRQPRDLKWPFVLLLLVGATFLLLARSRTNLAAMTVGVSIAWLAGANWQRRATAAFAVPVVACVLAFGILLFDVDVADRLANAATLGRADTGDADELGLLNGRVPLWLHLADYIHERPITGHGFDSFWNAGNIEDISDEFQWTVPTAHSVWVDLALNLGYVGLTIAVLAVVLVLWRVTTIVRRTGDPGCEFVMALFVFALCSSVFESDYIQPSGFVSFVAACGLMRTVLKQTAGTAPATRSDLRSTTVSLTRAGYA